MASDRQKLEEIFHRAREISDAKDRAQYLDQA